MYVYLKITKNQIYLCYITYKPRKSLIPEQLHSITKKCFFTLHQWSGVYWHESTVFWL